MAQPTLIKVGDSVINTVHGQTGTQVVTAVTRATTNAKSIATLTTASNTIVVDEDNLTDEYVTQAPATTGQSSTGSGPATFVIGQ